MTTTSFESRFRSALANAERTTFISYIRENPQMTLSELVELSGGDLADKLGGVTIGEIISGTPSEQPPKAADSAPKGRPAAVKPESDGKSKRGQAVDVRSPAGRKAYDAGVLAALGQLGAKKEEKGVPAPEVAKIAGGEPEQVRSALNRLISEGKVSFGGKARGTRYWLA